MDVECEDQDGLVEKKEDSLRIEENDKSDDGKEEIVSPSNDNIVQKDKVYSGKNNVDINVSLQNVTSKTEKVSENIRNTDQVCENGKRKLKEEKPPTKVVVRRLPPLMTKEIFLEQVSPLPPYDYMYFVNGDPSYGLNSFSRAYLNFVSQEDVFTFTRTFDNYVFVDTKGQEYPAIVEFSPFQRVPKHRSKKKDALTGTIESDSMYITFKENLLAEALENSKPGAKTVKQHYFETEISTAEEINTTPLLEYLKQRRAEKARIRDERREEKKRKETERKMKQKTKDKKIDGEDEDAPKDVKVIQSKDKRETKDKDLKYPKKKEEKEKLLKENRSREFKNRIGKSYQEERIRQAERREERRKEIGGVVSERKSESQGSDGKETETAVPLTTEEKKNRSYIEKKKSLENKKKNDEDWKGEGDPERKIRLDRNRGERRQRERKRREEFASRKGFEKKITDNGDKKKFKVYKSTTKEWNNETKENVYENDCVSLKQKKIEESVEDSLSQKGVETSDKSGKNFDDENNKKDKGKLVVAQRRKSLESDGIISEVLYSCNSKRRNSLESGNAVDPKFKLDKFFNDDSKSKNYLEVVDGYKNESKEENNTYKIYGADDKVGNLKKEQTKSSNRNNTEIVKVISTNDDDRNTNGDAKHKSSEGMKNSESNSSRINKDPRTDRRIRNKDRPSLQIYRPGMGKFSKQRMEKEKVLGSSTEQESPSHSPSPTSKHNFSQIF